MALDLSVGSMAVAVSAPPFYGTLDGLPLPQPIERARLMRASGVPKVYQRRGS
jgi:hypothetical protein